MRNQSPPWIIRSREKRRMREDAERGRSASKRNRGGLKRCAAGRIVAAWLPRRAEPEAVPLLQERLQVGHGFSVRLRRWS